MKNFKNTSELYEHYGRDIIPMCKGTGIDPWQCVRYKGVPSFNWHPPFDQPPGEYETAIGLLIDGPVFVDDKVWDNIIKQWIPASTDALAAESDLTHNKPAPVFTINDEMFPCPTELQFGAVLKIASDGGPTATFAWADIASRDKVAKKLIRILKDNTK